MKTIDDISKDSVQQYIGKPISKVSTNYDTMYVSNAIRACIDAVTLSQRRIPVKEELPDSKNGYINKEVIAFTSDNCVYILIYDNYLGWIPNGTDADIDSITNWRPIELK